MAQLEFLASLGGDKPDGLFFAGDLGQRIFQQAFSWKALGVDIRGRSRTLRINYRTSHQIRRQADLLLGPEISDVDGNKEDRRGTVSIFNGPEPSVEAFDSPEEEAEEVGRWISERMEEGIKPHEIGVFVRSEAQLGRAREAAGKAGLPFGLLDEKAATSAGRVSIGTMHLAKGLEFRAVAAMACDDEIVPLRERIETVGDESDLEEVYNTERHLLYVACTRARDRLFRIRGRTRVGVSGRSWAVNSVRELSDGVKAATGDAGCPHKTKPLSGISISRSLLEEFRIRLVRSGDPQ